MFELLAEVRQLDLERFGVMANTMSVGAALCLVIVVFAQVFGQANALPRRRAMGAPEMAPVEAPTYAPEYAPMATPMYAPEMAPVEAPMYAPEMAPMMATPGNVNICNRLLHPHF